MAFDRELYEAEKRIYLEENKDLFIKTNPHPKELNVGDCVKRALVISTGMDYNELKIKINQHKREMQKRKRKRPIRVFNDDRNWIPFMEKEFNDEKLFKKVNNTVLLSPSAASFDQFKNFENRGNEFKKLCNLAK